ncbi:GTP-binding protein ryh1 [Tritrichomonas foetus]|uniref:GTP-binding protein ryh1 n=1 Tax=Tritrichomonas foetus TaxID=1144522 RepID=A0A1J4J8K4_9EUKA|nr:GTP-binding protein ryh1 [Tritrichomonas foetus]|eukprot:OHS93564.1 GTP-binding protein ryh1 [Tritrichomonas foetus]
MDLQTYAKAVLCGSSSVGKTTIFSRILQKNLNTEFPSTMGASFASVKVPFNDEEITVNLWDTAGQEEYRSLVNIYFRNSNIALIVFDLTNHESFDQVDEWIDEILANCGDSPPNFLIIGNKSDLIYDKKVTDEEINDYIETIKCPYFEISAKEGQNFGDLCKKIGELALNFLNETAEQKEKKKEKTNETFYNVSDLEVSGNVKSQNCC